MVRTSRSGRDNPSSNPAEDICAWQRGVCILREELGEQEAQEGGQEGEQEEEEEEGEDEEESPKKCRNIYSTSTIKYTC